MNFKRNKPRIRTYRKSPNWLKTPAWWNRMFNRHKTRDRILENKIIKEEIDSEEALWQLHKKPHKYYW